jgi:hypothetical protein
MAEANLVATERIERAILVLRGHKVMLDSDLAILYGVETKVLNQAVSRNIERFPEDFMFQLTEAEAAFLRSQTVTLKTGRGQHRKYLPYAFTEQGVAMLSSVLRSPRAVRVNIEIMRAFVRLRRFLATHKELAELERSLATHDRQIQSIFEAIRRLMEPAPAPEPKRRRIGFQVKEARARYGRGLPPRNSPRPPRERARVRGMLKNHYAHSENGEGTRHDLVEHLNEG